VAAWFVLTTGGCSYLSYFNRGEPLAEGVGLIAVLPIERSEPPTPATAQETPLRLAANADDIVTAQIYSVLSESAHWRFVADLTVSEALRKVDRHAGLANRAAQLGKAVKADAVLCGTVSRLRERDGSEYGARQPAAISFNLELISAKTGAVLWSGEFDKMQEPLSSNLFNWWMFWRAGPKWFSAAELTRLGVQSLLEDLDRRMYQ
jgi:TolB-like protein